MNRPETRENYQHVIDELGLMKTMADFDPIVIGTPPLGIAIDNSDIDIACSAESLSEFTEHVQMKFSKHNDFEINEIRHLSEPACVAKFSAMEWDIELFCQTMPTQQQWGVRHFFIEQRLLDICPELKARVIALKQNGVKTEPAFAQLLSLKGDPYEAMLELEELADDDILALCSSEESK
jgi:hypothetical protein